jgi:hypothetical protein
MGLWIHIKSKHFPGDSPTENASTDISGGRSEKRVDKRRHCTASSENNQQTEQQQDDDDRCQPEFLPLFHEEPEIFQKIHDPLHLIQKNRASMGLNTRDKAHKVIRPRDWRNLYVNHVTLKQPVLFENANEILHTFP